MSTFSEVLVGAAAGGLFIWLFVVAGERLALRRNVIPLVRYRAEQRIRSIQHDTIRSLIETANLADRRPGGGRDGRRDAVDLDGDGRS